MAITNKKIGNHFATCSKQNSCNMTRINQFAHIDAIRTLKNRRAKTAKMSNR